MPNPRVAPWYRFSTPAVMYADRFTVAALKKAGRTVNGPPSEPGWWWSADDGWNGPFSTEREAHEAGRKFILSHRT